MIPLDNLDQAITSLLHRLLPDELECELTADDKVYIEALSGKHKLQFVRQALKLFHMTEFLLLIEFTEVVITVIYGSLAVLLPIVNTDSNCYIAGAFLVVVFHLPNRIYYAQLEDWDEHQREHKIKNWLAYASLELLSFIALAVIFFFFKAAVNAASARVRA